MKKSLSLFALASLIALCSFANYDDGIVSVTNFSRFGVRVVVDGRLYSDRDNNFIIPNLCPGYHMVKVYRYDDRYRGIFGNGGNDCIFSNSVYVKPHSEIGIVIHRRGRVSVEEQHLRGHVYRDDDDDDRYDNRNDHYRDYHDQRQGDDYRN